METKALAALGLPLVGLFGPPVLGHAGGTKTEDEEVEEEQMGPVSAALCASMRRPLLLRRPDEEVSVVAFNLLLQDFETKPYYPTVSAELRAWKRRRESLRRLIFSLDADVVCAQEAQVTNFAEEFAFLASGGYAAVEPRADKGSNAAASAERLGLAKCAVFFKTSRLELQWQEHRSRAVLCALRHRPSGRLLYVVSCHLEGHPREAAARLNQTRSALERLRLEMRRRGAEPESCAIVFAGDFNGPEGSASCECLRRGGLPEGVEDPWAPGQPLAGFSHDFKFRDLYDGGGGGGETGTERPPTFCAPGSRPVAIDYVFYTPQNLRPTALRRPFDEEQLAAAKIAGIPSEWHPSDHVPIGGVFQFLPEGSDGNTNTEWPGPKLETM